MKTEENLQRCPNCKLTNPPGALRCDCGYDFTTGKLPESPIRAKHFKQLTFLKGSLLFVWLIIGPILCYAFANLLFPGENFFGHADPGRTSRYIIGAALAATAMFLLPIPIWLRFVTFAVYATIVAFVLPILLILIACYVFGNCL